MNPETRPRPSARGFETLGLEPELIAVLQTLGYTEPTPIQREAIPRALEARDLLACVQTGTGKTAAFALPILDELLRIEPREIRELATRLLYEPVEVAVDPVSSTVEPLSQSVYFVDGPRKLGLLLTLLASDQIARALVFTRTKRRADRLARSLSREGVEAAAIHGDKSQNTRVRTLEGFKRGHTRVLVATDVAARGIHVEDIDTVINFDIPNEPETYVHRVGRTGRAGASGTALTLCGSDERGQLAAIERLTGRKIRKLETPSGPARAQPQPRGHRGRGHPR